MDGSTIIASFVQVVRGVTLFSTQMIILMHKTQQCICASFTSSSQQCALEEPPFGWEREKEREGTFSIISKQLLEEVEVEVDMARREEWLCCIHGEGTRTVNAFQSAHFLCFPSPLLFSVTVRHEEHDAMQCNAIPKRHMNKKINYGHWATL